MQPSFKCASRVAGITHTNYILNVIGIYVYRPTIVLREQEFRATDEDGLSVLGEGAGR